MDMRLARLINKVDDSRITSVTHLKKERQDLLVSCESGHKHLIRFEKKYVSLLHQKWGYDTMHREGIPCPEVEMLVEPDKEFPEGCMILSWIDAIPAIEIIQREGQNDESEKLCHKLGRILHKLHSVLITESIPDYAFISNRQVAYEWTKGAVNGLLKHNLIDAAFAKRFYTFSDKYLELIPDPIPHNLCFWDMHFSNIIVYDWEEPEIAGFVDVEETGVGWPMWDFTNWERWELFYGNSWIRKPILKAYGEINMAMYKYAVIIRMSQYPELFAGRIKEQIIHAVDNQDAMYFDLEKLY